MWIPISGLSQLVGKIALQESSPSGVFKGRQKEVWILRGAATFEEALRLLEPSLPHSSLSANSDPPTCFGLSLITFLSLTDSVQLNSSPAFLFDLAVTCVSFSGRIGA
ncbi:hypothetical protein Nepgr_014354 [Nepenthes gracilis]|uniref:Uncharacterized protein n=1 Tax=Nepenthes gracilis TaxID=150966 RepID=A0AAD3SJC7_NEPGR|nr:hypothetical protein Nepgr_014354 [Nepenthes gracilis]